jgi:hypothetical protein
MRHTPEQISAVVFPSSAGVITAEEYVNEDSTNFGEYGQVLLTTTWQTIQLRGQYERPVVVFSDPTTPGQDSIIVRVRSVTEGSFEARLQLPSYLSGTYNNQVSFIVVEEGEWHMENGARLSAGRTEMSHLTTQGWSRISADFTNRPSVLTQVQSANDNAWVITRVRNLSASGFQLSLQEEERTQRSGHGREVVGWIMMDQGSFMIDGQGVLSMHTQRAIDHRARRVSYSTPLSAAPSVIAKLGSSHGLDPANVSVSHSGANGFNVRVAEERSRDREVAHTLEELSLLVLSGSSGILKGER